VNAPRSAFAPERSPVSSWAIPVASILLASTIAAIPVLATFPFLPPFGLLMLLGWRLLRPETVRIWAPLPFGLFDDLLSGQPLGSAMLLWTVSVLVIDLLDQRLVSREFWQDWGLAAGGIAFSLIGGRLIATPIAAHVDTPLLCQVAISILCYPIAARLVAALDRKRSRT